jgi:cytidylate kinase
VTSSGDRGNLVIAIDGPAGAGKSTLARDLAGALHIAYVNTGLMYRALAAAALRGHLDTSDAGALEIAARNIRFDLDGGHPASLLIDGSPPGPELETGEVEAAVSLVSRHPAVREVMRAAQRELGERGAVMEGRDIATVVFPDADVKIFVTASPEVRVARRFRERGVASAGDALERRDELDSRTNPLEPSEGAVVIDSTELSLIEVLDRALELVAAARPDRFRSDG